MSDPTSRESLDSQAERTALAWSRTLIGLSAVIGFLAVHAAIGGASAAAVVSLGIIAAVTLVTSSVVSRQRWMTASAAMAGERLASRPFPMALMSAATLVVAVASMIVVFTDWR